MEFSCFNLAEVITPEICLVIIFHLIQITYGIDKSDLGRFKGVRKKQQQNWLDSVCIFFWYETSGKLSYLPEMY